ncbi:MAG: hypothetical protein ACXV8U_03755 [Methylobacter sp.]
MIDWYLKNKQLLRSLHAKAVDALRHCEDDEKQAAKTIASYMKSDFQVLCKHWCSMYPEEKFGYLGRHIGFAEQQDFSDIIKYDLPPIEERLDELLTQFEKSLPNSKTHPYVAEERIAELTEIENTAFDNAKLIRLLRELNVAYHNDAHFTTGILVRAVIDHIPPIFGFATFPEVANNYKGTKSFKSAMQRLNDSLRNLADSYLHVQIRKVESLPTLNQVDFRAELDALLSEVSRVLQDV